MSPIAANLQAVRQRIADAALACNRDASTICLLAVSKTFDAHAVIEAYKCGQTAFGENYVQEAVDKIAAVNTLVESEPTDGDSHRTEWHFIGPIQTNKTRLIAENFDWVHSIDRIKVAERLDAARSSLPTPLHVCIQVNIGDEQTKGGVSPADTLALARSISKLSRLKLRGLMAIPPASDDRARQRRYCAMLRDLKDDLTAAGIALDTLSMGMSGDLEAAVAEGATIVRVGTAIFGPRAARSSKRIEEITP
jgi:pyridoxal phosphate enzyme (YggS family)